MTQGTEQDRAESVAQEDEILTAVFPDSGGPFAEFRTDDAGKTKGTAHAVGDPLLPTQFVSVNGSPDLRPVIVGKSGALVITISLAHLAGVTYRVIVHGKEPTSGSFFLWFTDQSGRRHKLELKDPSPPMWFHLDYTSLKPGITKIEWSSQ